MRAFESNKKISVHAIAGSHVVLLGLNASTKARKGLLGFSIEKKSGRGGFKPLLGGKRKFANLDMEPESASTKAPIQSFMWSDYVVAPGTAYTYRVTPIYGKPDALTPGDAVEVKITSEKNDDGKHAIFFNRGVAGSQAYSRRFGKHLKYYPTEVGFGDNTRLVGKPFIKPGDVPDGEAFKWLSRGLEEAMLKFIGQAKGKGWSLRAAVYEFTWMPVLNAFADALDRGADVRVIHHAKEQSEFVMKYQRGPVTTSTWADGSKPDVVFKNRFGRRDRVPDSVAAAANKAVEGLGVQNADRFDALENMMIQRTNTQISHNKFIVLLKDDVPVQVWTGSTNFTDGGIFGQSNVGHIVRDPNVAKQYMDYWERLSDDPKRADAAEFTAKEQPDLKGEPPEGITCVFSPRKKVAMLDWYADRIAKAKNSVFFTTAFTVADQILDVVRKDSKSAGDTPFQRYLLMEGNGGLLRKKIPVIQKCKQNTLAWGDVLRARKNAPGDEDLQLEALTGLNDHVNYLHTKYMLIDPLGDDPVVVSGSANFSENSTTKNDENMLIIRGNQRVADMFLVEFMRLFNHFESRNTRNSMSDEEFADSRDLVSDDTWTDPFFIKGASEYNERLLFAGPGQGL